MAKVKAHRTRGRPRNRVFLCPATVFVQPLVGLWIQILRIPYGVMFPLILIFCVIGVYGTVGSPFHLGLMLIFGVLGYLLRRTGHDLAPMILGFVLGPLLEVNVRRSLIASDGDWGFLLTRPIGLTCVGLAALILIISVVPAIRAKRAVLKTED